MDRSFRAVLVALAGTALLAGAAALNAIALDAGRWAAAIALAGLALLAWGGFGLRTELSAMVRARRGEIALQAAGMVGIVVAIVYLCLQFPLRYDLSSAGLFSLSEQSERMLERLDKPVHIIFFHDPMMRETVELYRLFASKSDQLTVEFIDPMVNPAQARMRGVEFAGTAIMESEGRKLTVNGPTETDIANGILRVSQGAQQTVCFLDGHGEPDPFSRESHDHSEGTAGHSHGLGQKLVVHERHGMAKARGGLEALNYVARKVLLQQANQTLVECALLVVAGPKTPLLPTEVKSIGAYLSDGGSVLFMLDPFVQTGLEPLLREYGVVADDTIVIDQASHFWTDISAPAVSDYNPHQITLDLPLTFFPGARSLSPTPKRVPGVHTRPLINSSRQSFCGSNREKPEFDPGRDRPGPCTIMVMVNRQPGLVAPAETMLRELRGEKVEPEAPELQPEAAGNRTRFAVIGDSDFATNSFFHVMGNGKLFLNTVNFLASRENLIGIEPRTYDTPQINLTNRQMRGTFFLSIILVPALMALVGVAVWWRQR